MDEKDTTANSTAAPTAPTAPAAAPKAAPAAPAAPKPPAPAAPAAPKPPAPAAAPKIDTTIHGDIDDTPKVPAVEASQLEMTGVPGGAFAAYGVGFSKKGTLMFGDRTVETTAWYTNNETGITKVKAVVPSDIPRGTVVTIRSGGKTFTGKL